MRGRAAFCMLCASLRAVALANVTLGFPSVCDFVCFYDICQLCRAGMSCRVNIYSLSGGGSIGILPGVVPAAWGGLWRARRAVRAAPKTRNCITSRVKMWLEPLRHTTFLPVQPGGVPVTVSPLLTPPLLRLGSVGVL